GLAVGDFPPSQKTQNREGKHVLITERTVARSEGTLPALSITLSGLPVPGVGRWIAVAIAAIVLVVGFGYLHGTKSGPMDDDAFDELVEAREALLGEIVTLERLRRSGEVGPKTYDRLKKALLDALARIVEQIDQAKKARHAEDRRARGAV